MNDFPMKKHPLKRWFALLGAALIIPAWSAYAAGVSLPDSLLTIDCVYKYTFSDFELAKQIMEQLRKRQTEPLHKLDAAEGDLYYNTEHFTQALRFYGRALESKPVQNDPQLYMEQIYRMISCYDGLHDEARKAKYVDLLLQKAKACGDEAMQSVALFNMGKMLYYEGNKDRGFEYMQEATEQMARTDYKYKFDNLRYNYNTLLIFQEWDKRFEDALRTLDALAKIVTDNSADAVQMNGLDEKQQKALIAHRAVVLCRMGRKSEADKCYSQFLALGKPTDRDNYLILPYLFARERYDEIIRINTEREKRYAEQGDTVNYAMTSVKKALGHAYREKGDYKRAARYYEELAILRDSIKIREQKSAALELAAVYETNEKELRLHEQDAEIRLRTIGLAFVCSIVLLQGTLLWRTHRYSRTIRRKNESMVNTIEELLSYKDELYRQKERNNQLRERLHEEHPGDPIAPADATTSTEPDTAPAPESETGADYSDRILFDRIEQRIIGERLFLKPDFSREELMGIIHIPKNRFAQLFRRYAGTNFPKYVNNLRLDYAAKMLRKHPGYTIDAIAKSCGMSTVQTFHRLFLEKFGVTPMEFQRGLKNIDK